MAKEILVSESLTNEMISVGETLLKKLDKSDAKVSATFWLYYPEEKTWKLFFTSELVKSEGPKKYYKKVVDALNDFADKDSTLSLNNIGVTDNSNKILQLLASVFNSRKSIVKERLSRETINGQFIEDAFVYRVNLRT